MAAITMAMLRTQHTTMNHQRRTHMSKMLRPIHTSCGQHPTHTNKSTSHSNPFMRIHSSARNHRPIPVSIMHPLTTRSRAHHYSIVHRLSILLPLQFIPDLVTITMPGTATFMA